MTTTLNPVAEWRSGQPVPHLDVSLKMFRSRIVVGLAVAIGALGPLLFLAQLSYDYRYGDFPLIFERCGERFPQLSEIFVPFGPIDWWSYATPIALGVAASAALRTPLSGAASIVILLGAFSQLVTLWAAFLPYSMLLQKAGVPIPTPYPRGPLLANASMVGVSIGLAVWSVARLRAALRTGKETNGEQGAAGQSVTLRRTDAPDSGCHTSTFCQKMKTLIKLTRYPYEEPYHIHLLLEAANGMQHASIEYYTNAQDLSELGTALIQFPFTATKEHIYEIGSDNPVTRCAYHIRLRFFLIRPTGTCGIEVHFNNNRPKAPYRETADFTIQAEVAGINRLGQLLKEFGRLEHRVLEWGGIDGQLLQSEEAERGSDDNGGTHF